MRNTVKKQSSRKTVRIERRNLGNLEELRLLTETCAGCGLCADICPLHAITFMAAATSDGQLLRKARIDIDPMKCLFCGACVAICPQNALELVKNGKSRIPLQDSGTIPHIMKSISVQATRCEMTCNLVCQDVCPTDAIRVKVGASVDESKRVENVEIEPKLCNFCNRCEDACPFGSITVERPFAGTGELKSSKCKENCRICIELCPTAAIERDSSGRMMLETRFCIFCRACEKSCPEKAIRIQIRQLNTSGERSGTWFSLLEKMTSAQRLSTELSKVSLRKRRKSAAGRIL